MTTLKSLKLNQLTMNVHVIQVDIKHIKLIYANTKQKCVKIIHKWVTVLIELSASLLMEVKNFLDQLLLLKKLIGLKNANLFGKKEYAVTVSDASFFTMNQVLKREKISYKQLVNCFAILKKMVEADYLQSWKMAANEAFSPFLLIIYSLFLLLLNFLTIKS